MFRLDPGLNLTAQARKNRLVEHLECTETVEKEVSHVLITQGYNDARIYLAPNTMHVLYAGSLA